MGNSYSHQYANGEKRKHEGGEEGVSKKLKGQDLVSELKKAVRNSRVEDVATFLNHMDSADKKRLLEILEMFITYPGWVYNQERWDIFRMIHSHIKDVIPAEFGAQMLVAADSLYKQEFLNYLLDQGYRTYGTESERIMTNDRDLGTAQKMIEAGFVPSTETHLLRTLVNMADENKRLDLVMSSVQPSHWDNTTLLEASRWALSNGGPSSYANWKTLVQSQHMHPQLVRAALLNFMKDPITDRENVSDVIKATPEAIFDDNFFIYLVQFGLNAARLQWILDEIEYDFSLNTLYGLVVMIRYVDDVDDVLDRAALFKEMNEDLNYDEFRFHRGNSILYFFLNHLHPNYGPYSFGWRADQVQKALDMLVTFIDTYSIDTLADEGAMEYWSETKAALQKRHRKNVFDFKEIDERFSDPEDLEAPAFVKSAEQFKNGESDEDDEVTNQIIVDNEIDFQTPSPTPTPEPLNDDEVGLVEVGLFTPPRRQQLTPPFHESQQPQEQLRKAIANDNFDRMIEIIENIPQAELWEVLNTYQHEELADNNAYYNRGQMTPLEFAVHDTNLNAIIQLRMLGARLPGPVGINIPRKISQFRNDMANSPAPSYDYLFELLRGMGYFDNGQGFLQTYPTNTRRGRNLFNTINFEEGEGQEEEIQRADATNPVMLLRGSLQDPTGRTLRYLLSEQAQEDNNKWVARDAPQNEGRMGAIFLYVLRNTQRFPFAEPVLRELLDINQQSIEQLTDEGRYDIIDTVFDRRVNLSENLVNILEDVIGDQDRSIFDITLEPGEPTLLHQYFAELVLEEDEEDARMFLNNILDFTDIDLDMVDEDGRTYEERLRIYDPENILGLHGRFTLEPPNVRGAEIEEE